MAKYGLSLQSDGKDSMARTHLVNIITTTLLGPEFRETIDVSGQYRDAEHTEQYNCGWMQSTDCLKQIARAWSP